MDWHALTFAYSNMRMKKCPQSSDWGHHYAVFVRKSYFRDSSTATATETVIPTMGLLPAPRKPIIST